MKRGTYLFILWQKYAHYVIHVSFNTYLLMFLQSPNFYVKNTCIMQNTVSQPISQSISQSVSSSVSQSISQSVSQSVSPSVSQLLSQSVHQSDRHLVSQSVSQSVSPLLSQIVSQETEIHANSQMVRQTDRQPNPQRQSTRKNIQCTTSEYMKDHIICTAEKDMKTYLIIAVKHST